MPETEAKAVTAAVTTIPPTGNLSAAADQATAMMQVFKEIAMAPDANQKVEVIRAMMEMQRQLQKDQAERSLNIALAEINIPHVKKNGKIPLPSKDGTERDVPFARWEDIDTVMRPLLRAQGLSLSFTAPKRSVDGGGADMTGRLSHRDGAYRDAEISLPLDTGPGRNNLQAMGSTISYGKKYLAFMLLNVVTEGQDDDGASAELVTNEQAVEIDLRIREVGADRVKFLAYLKTDDVQKIRSKDYKKAMAALQKKADDNTKSKKVA